MTEISSKWHAQPAMQLVVGVLLSTLLSGVVILSAAILGNDPLVISETDYQQLRDDFRLTESRNQEGD